MVCGLLLANVDGDVCKILFRIIERDDNTVEELFVCLWVVVRVRVVATMQVDPFDGIDGISDLVECLLILALQFVLVLAVKVDCWVYGFCFHNIVIISV